MPIEEQMFNQYSDWVNEVKKRGYTFEYFDFHTTAAYNNDRILMGTFTISKSDWSDHGYLHSVN